MIEVTLLCSNKSHPIYEHLEGWCLNNKNKISANLINQVDSIEAGGDILFLVSCTEIVPKSIRKMFRYSLVLHASDLPNGRGWSPHIWDIISGKDKLTVSLLNAEDSVDTGDIWKQKHIKLNGLELYDEINSMVFEAELNLISWACKNIDINEPKKQSSIGASYHRKREPSDSKIDINKSILEQFNLLRACDPFRYPAFFELNGQKFKLLLERYDEE